MNSLLMRVFGFEFQTPVWLWLFVFFGIVFILRARMRPRAIPFASLLLFLPQADRSASPSTDGAPLPVSLKARCVGVPNILKAVATAILILAAARPISKTKLPDRPAGIDVVLAIDVSSSMRANDLDPTRTRLDVAKAAAERFCAMRATDRIGLVAFARFPDLKCPTTLDHRALASFLRALPMVEADGPEDATGIGAAVMLAAATLEEGGSKSKIIVLFTDGEENVASAEAPGEIAPVHAAQFAAERGIRVYSVSAGIGSPGPNGTFLPIDITEVKRLAERTGGRFFEARDARAVERVFADIDRLEKSEFDEPRYAIADRCMGFMIAGLALLFIALGLESTILEVIA